MDQHRSDGHLDARARELGLLQELGRRTAGAETPEALLHVAAELFQRELDLELLVAALDEAGSDGELLAFLARPVADATLEAIAASLTGQPPSRAGRRLRSRRLEDYDERRGERSRLAPDDVVSLALSRAGRPAGRLGVVLPGPPDEARFRLLNGAANQLSLHLERILTGREREQDRFRAILDSMPQTVLLTDPELNVVQGNRAAEAARARLGLPARGGRLDRIGDLEGRDLVERLGSDGPAAGELRLADDSIWTVTVTAETGTGGGGLVWVLTDVTESRRLQQQLAQSEKMSSIGQMISGIAHELNNPLASILGYSQLLRAKAGEGKLAERLDVLHTEATRCQKIVRNLLSFARRHEPERKPLSLNEVVQSVIGLVRYQLKVDDIRVTTDLDRELPLIEGDAHQLQQVLVNLFTNAQHAIRGAGGGGTIEVGTRLSENGRAVLEVRDDGPGIPEPLRDRIFDPFFSTKEVGQGTGLGLSLVYGIVESHGGTISVESEPGRGTRFRVELPTGTRGAEDRPAATAEAAPVTPPGYILVVDDEAPLATLICEALAADGHRVRPVANGREALDCLERERFDLIVSDIKMPVMDGRRLVEEIEARQPSMRDRLLLTTGDTVSLESERFARGSGLPVLHKPFDLDDLRRKVRTRLSRGKRPGREGSV